MNKKNPDFYTVDVKEHKNKLLGGETRYRWITHKVILVRKVNTLYMNWSLKEHLAKNYCSFYIDFSLRGK